MALGRVQIDINIVEANASPSLIGDVLKAAQWDVKGVSIRNGYAYQVVSVTADMHSSLDTAQIIAWIRQDLGSRFTIGNVNVKILSQTTPKVTTPNKVTTPITTTPTNNTELAAVNSRLDALIANLNKSNTTTKKTLDTYAAEFGVSKTALTLLVAAVGITVLLSLTKK